MDKSSVEPSIIETLPVHVAIIMDGNGRWAEERNKPRLFGHRAGVESVKNTVETAREIGIQHLTLYAFSTENWRRPTLEVKGLMGLLKAYLKNELANLQKNDIRLCCLGQREKLPDDVRRVLESVIAQTAGNRSLTLNLALSYGSRDEMLMAMKNIAKRCAVGEINPENIDEQLFTDYLYTAGQPDPDLMIRTSGEQRLSNFMLWQLSYAELYFTDIKWPDFRREQFLEALRTYSNRQRRFGKTGAQLRQE